MKGNLFAVKLVKQVNNILMKFTKNQFERYSRQIILKKVGIAGQKKLLKSKSLTD